MEEEVVKELLDGQKFLKIFFMKLADFQVFVTLFHVRDFSAK
jgi:hypothetical protein